MGYSVDGLRGYVLAVRDALARAAASEALLVLGATPLYKQPAFRLIFMVSSLDNPQDLMVELV